MNLRPRVSLLVTIMSSTTKKSKGGRKGWTTPAQHRWLTDLIPAYLTARTGGTRTLTPFQNKLYEGWFTRWPELPADLSPSSVNSEQAEVAVEGDASGVNSEAEDSEDSPARAAMKLVRVMVLFADLQRNIHLNGL